MKMLENLPIPGFVADPEWGNRWNIGNNQGVIVYLDSSGNLVVNKDSKFTLHTVLNATTSDLEKLPRGRGVSVLSGSAYTASLNAHSLDGVRAQLAIHEFNVTGALVNRTLVSNLDRVLFVSTSQTTHLAVSVRTVGQGSVTLRGLEFNPAVTNKAEPGVHKHGKVVEPGYKSRPTARDAHVWLLPVRQALYNDTPLSALMNKKDALEACAALLEGGHFLEVKEIVRRLDLYGDLTTSQLRKVFWHARRTGYLQHAVSTLDEIVIKSRNSKDEVARNLLREELDFQKDPWSVLDKLDTIDAYDPNGPVLHMVGKSLPERQTGYTLRTKYTTEALANAGIKSVVAVQGGGNFDIDILETQRREHAGVSTVIFPGLPKNKAPRASWMKENSKHLFDLVKREKPSVIHAHSDFVNGVLATCVGEATGVPVVYESRGFWEETWLSRIARAQNWENTDHIIRMYGAPELYSLRRDTERRVRERADRVITLAKTMQDFILSESPGMIKSDKISLARNAVDPKEFPVEISSRGLKSNLGISSESTVIGYISSIVEYEGIETLINAFSMLSQKSQTSLVIVGDGPHLNSLRRYVESRNIKDVVFTGRVPHEDILSYYHTIDIFVVPRRRTTVTELVTPLKPFEAFSTGRAVVMSDVAALAEIAEDSGGAARTFRADDAQSLRSVLEDLLDAPGERARMGEQGAKWIRSERSWESNVAIYSSVYAALRKPSTTRGASKW
ncbi:glycosyltransferase [Nesterenkonia halotolerans]|uniref:D-inositol 3-phosphate glycosyltransferase n=1 Tax=Nesterenkonia halotolerans TaxID=225325 RepID=A0ABR9J9U3_9MICC|nr:glycosyltransferase [Nesterenkonia halotolerans]MBE1515767.1 glycosyltransferase involved in cell wall biosynthesis [Nesterenkonia halotolerans]